MGVVYMCITIRAARPGDLARLVYIEEACFPAAEAATEESLRQRLAAFTHSFLVAEKNGRIVGFINGCVTFQRILTDDLYESVALHQDEGPCMMVFGLDVLPEEQHRGYAGQLMRAYMELAKQRHKKLITLTCKARLIHFYEQFGYICEGLSGSTHGGVDWYDMTVYFDEKEQMKGACKVLYEMMEQGSQYIHKYNALPRSYAGGSTLYPVETHTLQRIGRAKGITVWKLAEEMNKTPSAVSQITSKLRRAGFIHAEKNEKNNRETFLSLSKTGRAIYDEHEKLDDAMMAKFAELLQHLSVKDIQTCVAVQRTLNGQFYKNIHQLMQK
jgi:DNA-binding MarR family transcriptional regulator/predicted N-acetyltransferase YhbS